MFHHSVRTARVQLAASRSRILLQDVLRTNFAPAMVLPSLPKSRPFCAIDELWFRHLETYHSASRNPSLLHVIPTRARRTRLQRCHPVTQDHLRRSVRHGRSDSVLESGRVRLLSSRGGSARNCIASIEIRRFSTAQNFLAPSASDISTSKRIRLSRNRLMRLQAAGAHF